MFWGVFSSSKIVKIKYFQKSAVTESEEQQKYMRTTQYIHVL